MEALKIGYLALSKASWRTAKIDALMEDTVKNLSLLEHAELHHPGKLITAEDEAEQACAELRSADIDVLVMHFITFPVGALIPAVGTRIGTVPGIRKNRGKAKCGNRTLSAARISALLS